ncbi:MAG: CYTH domain-containing protein [Desulfobulbaceae bacterium]|nr:MAG: CYTH domain-containing protein [Desulfobulbaceae bacterium]
MARNIEIKASINSIADCMEIAKDLSDSDPEILHQTDYFFNCTNGRLKLRVFSPDSAELIFYTRANDQGPKPSEYFISRTAEPDMLREVLQRSYGIDGVVEKTRTLFLIGRTRVHLDEVKNLGEFLEFEAVLSPGEHINNGIDEVHLLMDKFGIKKTNLITGAYIDLIKQK